jgi:hypothetical protein
MPNAQRPKSKLFILPCSLKSTDQRLGTFGAGRQFHRSREFARANVPFGLARKRFTPRNERDTALHLPNPIHRCRFRVWGTLVGTLSGISGAWAACADKEGTVFISTTVGYNPEILEYKHGEKNPTAVVEDGNSAYFPYDCSVDPSTGNLAVANAQAYYGESSGNVAIYAGAQGTPTFVSDSRIPYPLSCAYDSKGNLYVEGSDSSRALKFAVIKHTEQCFKSFSLNTELCCSGPVIWKNDRLDVAAGLSIYEFKIKGRSGREAITVEIARSALIG